MLTLTAVLANAQVVKTASVEAVGYKNYVATAYCLQGRMANGQKVHSGAVAVDPRLIPLGSQIDILGLGTWTAKDTGGDIKGNRLDLWFPSCSQALKFGRRTVKVKVLQKTLVRKI